MRALLAVLLLLQAAGLQAASTPAKPSREILQEQREATAKLPEKYRQWLLEVAPILSGEERAAFLTLTKDYQRDAFIERFWQARNTNRGGGPNFYREHWQEKVIAARERFKGDLTDERARIFLLNGAPEETFIPDCQLLLVPIEVWYYSRSDLVPGQLIIVFYRKWGAVPFRIWHPRDGVVALYAEGVGQQAGESPVIGAGSQNAKSGGTAPIGGGALRPDIADLANGCNDTDQAMKLLAALDWVTSQGIDWDLLEARFDAPPAGKGGEWVATFNSYSTDVREGAAALSARLEVDFPGRRLSRTVVQGVVTVAAGEETDGAVETRLGEHRSYDLLLNGEVLRDGVLFDSFRYKFDFPAGETSLPLVFQRWLRPGDYTLVVRVEDLGSGKQFRAEQPLSVPQVDREAPGPAPVAASMDSESARLFAEATSAATGQGSGEPMIRIVRPHGEMQTGLQRFDTLLAGAGIAGVTFLLDGKPVLTKRKPPFSVELDLGLVPHMRTLAVTAFAADGVELARDELTLNAAGHRFRVHLVEPQRGKRYGGSLLARAEVETPEGETLEKVEIYLDETRIATLFQPPWVQPVALPANQGAAYVRAVASLTDGSSTEDLVFVNAPENLEEMDVDAVELYATVFDRDGHPVSGLAAKDFTVLEDGKRQEIVRCEQVSDLSIHAVVALDVSASMETSLDRAREAALRFLQKTIRPKDRAAVIPFNDHPTLAVKFTHDLETLAGGLAGLKAERGTALYDSLIFTLYYFNGVKGQRAILLLSDGKDEGSRFTWEETLETVRRAGVTIYAIGLGDQVEKKKLERLSEETGGRAFFLDDASQLDEIYARIEEELRSQVLVVYQSSRERGTTAFRTVDLKVGRKGLEAKTIRGYYP